jgi:hypothetical protein
VTSDAGSGAGRRGSATELESRDQHTQGERKGQGDSARLLGRFFLATLHECAPRRLPGRLPCSCQSSKAQRIARGSRLSPCANPSLRRKPVTGKPASSAPDTTVSARLTGNPCGRTPASSSRLRRRMEIVCLGSGGLKGCPQLLGAHCADPLLNDLAFAVQQEDVRLHAVSELLLEAVVPWIINIEIDEVDLFTVLLFKPVHDGRQSLAGRSPEGEELDKRRASCPQGDRRRIGCLQPGADRGCRGRGGLPLGWGRFLRRCCGWQSRRQFSRGRRCRRRFN